MNIQRNSGIISFLRGSLGPEVHREQFLSSESAKEAKVVVQNEPWITFELWLEPDVIGNVVFNANKLIEVRILMTDGTEGAWSEDKEIARKRKHDNWLISTLGNPPYDYVWGKIESIYDARSMCSQIIFRYK